MTPLLREVLAAALAQSAPTRLCVGFSGGPDSSALLHALAQMPEARSRGLRALHVDHGLHPDSANWARRCGDFCAAHGVPLAVVRVDVDQTRGEGPEAAARRARRAAFARQLGEGEWLALAHHRDDQVETILLKLLRGAGPEGLGGMRGLCPFGGGFLWRPLLETRHDVLRNYLVENGIAWIDDPSNQEPRFARNLLRKEVLPRLRAGWPHADASILHAARLCRIAAAHVDAAAKLALQPLFRASASLDASGWLALPEALRAPVLDAWLHARGLPAPADDPRAELERQAREGGADRQPTLAWPGAEVRLWDGRLHAFAPLLPVPVEWNAAWNGAPIVLPADCGELRLAGREPGLPPLRAAALDPPLGVRFRRGGEAIKPAGDSHTRQLRNLFQQARLPPWLRARCPLVFEGETLVAVADLWMSARGRELFDGIEASPAWTRPGWA